MLTPPFYFTYEHKRLDNESYDEILYDLFCQYQHKGRSASDFIEEVIVAGLPVVNKENVTRFSVWEAYK